MANPGRLGVFGLLVSVAAIAVSGDHVLTGAQHAVHWWGESHGRIGNVGLAFILLGTMFGIRHLTHEASRLVRNAPNPLAESGAYLAAAGLAGLSLGLTAFAGDIVSLMSGIQPLFMILVGVWIASLLAVSIDQPKLGDGRMVLPYRASLPLNYKTMSAGEKAAADHARFPYSVPASQRWMYM